MKRFTSMLMALVMLVNMVPVALAAESNHGNPETYAETSNDDLISKKTLIDSATEWTYLDNNTDPAGTYERTSWTVADYGMRLNWKTAAGPFGAKYSDGVSGTTVSGYEANTLLEGCNKSKDTPAYFFRTTVNITDASKVTAINGSLIHDDGVTMYINGTRVFGHGDETGILEGKNQVYYSDAHQDAPHTCEISLDDVSTLVNGKNVIAVEIHQDRASSSDVFFALSNLTATVDGQEQTLINSDTVWSYLDDGSDPAGEYERTSWTAEDYQTENENFDATAWKTDAGPFGSKKGGDKITSSCIANTILNGTDGKNDTPAYFFRTTFEVTAEELATMNQLFGTVSYDDALLVYINGERVAAYEDEACDESGKGLGVVISQNLQYGGSNGGDPRTGTFTLTDLSLLHEGTNTIAVELHQGRKTSSDVWFDMSDLSLSKAVPEVSNISLSMGADQTEMNFTWHCTTQDDGTLRIAEYSDLVDGEMPVSATEFSATSVINNDSKYTNKATATDLKAGTTYAYQVVNGELKSEIYTFTTDGGDEAFSFAYVGDPQIGASGNATNDTSGWDKTLNEVATNRIFADISFMLSAGDQVNNASSESEYDGYLDHDALKSLPVATVIGNHDSSSNAYSQHFNVPNEDTKYETSTTAGSDYWFVYNNALFMVLNTNNLSTAEHKAFMEAAIEATKYQNIRWKIVTFHQSIYTVASHYNNDNTNRRETLVPVFDELDIDVVLQGHDHVYCRTYMMKNFAVSDTDKYTYGNADSSVPTAVTDPEGILYVTANSGSGSKHYGIKTDVEFPYSAAQNQERIPNVSKVSISDTQFTITTYRTNDMSVVDTFTINRTPTTSEVVLEGIAITTQPTKTVYTEGEKFDPAGMVATATYSDGSAKVVEDYSYAPADKLTYDVTEITVTYEGKTATIPVTVNKAVVDINTISDTGLVKYLSSYSTGYTDSEGGVAEIVKFNKENDCMYLVSGKTQTLDIVKVNADGSTTQVKKVDIASLGKDNGFSAGDITSVDVNTDQNLVAIAVQNAGYAANGVIVTLNYDGKFVSKYDAGVQPDMVTFSPNGNYILSANEGEPREGYGEGATDPMGSVTVVDLKENTAKTVTFETIDRETALSNKVLLKTDTAPSADLEPEFIAVSSDSKTAYVTLQENNAIAALNIADGTWKYVKGLGFKDHNAEGNGLDLDQDGKIDIRNENVYGVYMPDGISVVTIGGKDYLITANEGDAREWGEGDNEYVNIDSSKLVLSDGKEAGKKIEFLDTSKTDGLESGKTYILGGRSFSIWNADTLKQVFDSGDDFEVITAAEFPEYFNSGHDEAGLDKRSHKKGVEPESVSVLETNGKIYAIVGLERMGGIMVYDISDPDKAVYADYLNVRGFSGTVTDLDRLGDLGPEGICTISAKDSPTGNAMILVANEISGTVTVAQIEKVDIDHGDDDNENSGSSGNSSSGGSSKPSSGTSKDDKVEIDFVDVKDSAYYAKAVQWAVENGITSGTSATTFAPDQVCTRAQIATFLWRAQNASKAENEEMVFTDVSVSAYYYNAVLWAVENGITNGTSATTFSPDQACTRAQCVTFLWKAMAD